MVSHVKRFGFWNPVHMLFFYLQRYEPNNTRLAACWWAFASWPPPRQGYRPAPITSCGRTPVAAPSKLRTRLLAVQLDDELSPDLGVDVFAARQRGHAPHQPLRVDD